MSLESKSFLFKKIILTFLILVTIRVTAKETTPENSKPQRFNQTQVNEEGFRLQAGAFFRSNIQRRGALLYNKPILLPLLSFKYSDWLIMGRGGVELYQKYDWGKLSFSPSYFDDQVPFFDDEQDSFRKKRKASIEAQFKLSLNLIRRSKLELSYSKEIKNHQGNFLEASIMAPVTLKFPFLKVGMGFGVGDKKHNTYVFGSGAESGFAYHEFKVGLFLPFLPKRGIVILNYNSTLVSQKENEALSFVRKRDNLDSLSMLLIWKL